MTRSEIKEETKEKIDKIFRNIDRLEDQAEYLKNEKGVQFQEEMEKLKLKRMELEEKYNAMEDASEDVIKELKSASDEISNVIGSRMEKINDKIQAALS